MVVDVEVALGISVALLVVAVVAAGWLWRQRAALALRLQHTEQVKAQLETDVAVLRQRHADDERRLEEFKQQIEQHLKALAGDVMKESRAELLQQADHKLKPLVDLLAKYDQHYKQIEQTRSREHGGLRETIDALSRQTTSLVSALRRPEVRGRWGEIALRRIVELAGLTERCDFDEQATLEHETGRLRPDLIVRLPNERCVVIDSKIVLDAFMEAVARPEGEERTKLLQRHVGQIHEQVRRLSSKAYLDAQTRTPDFLVLFLPVESALYAAVDIEADLLERAMEKRIVIATPTLLIALLKAVEMGWREAKVAENAEKIRALGEELHERISKALRDVVQVGSSLGKTVRDYNTLVGSVDGRLMPTLRKFESTGARSAKEAPAAIEPIVEAPRDLRSAADQTAAP